MGYRSDDKWVVYPLYFDRNSSRKRGRRVSKQLAVEKPNIEQIASAAKSLGLHPVLEKECAHPAFHWKKNGRVLVDKKVAKEKTLNQIAHRL